MRPAYKIQGEAQYSSTSAKQPTPVISAATRAISKLSQAVSLISASLTCLLRKKLTQIGEFTSHWMYGAGSLQDSCGTFAMSIPVAPAPSMTSSPAPSRSAPECYNYADPEQGIGNFCTCNNGASLPNLPQTGTNTGTNYVVCPATAPPVTTTTSAPATLTPGLTSSVTCYAPHGSNYLQDLLAAGAGGDPCSAQYTFNLTAVEIDSCGTAEWSDYCDNYIISFYAPASNAPQQCTQSNPSFGTFCSPPIEAIKDACKHTSLMQKSVAAYTNVYSRD